MASNIIEFFGYHPSDKSDIAKKARAERKCPFLGKTCVKTLGENESRVPAGACTLQSAGGLNVICCPIRLYADNHKILTDVAKIAFGDNVKLYPGAEAKLASSETGGSRIAVFGKEWGGELRLPQPRGTGGYYVDWILAKLDDSGNLDNFVAIEVQSIDTTGNYRAERTAYLNEESFTGRSTAGFNWENVSKRILPQLIYKGNVLQRERRCQQGLFFISPTPVYKRISQRLGDSLLAYYRQTGSITFMWYDVGPEPVPGTLRSLNQEGIFTTSVVQVAAAFSAPISLPPQDVYEKAINGVL
ncbi:NotI family restriction endonuclease [Advenella mimigardefordensis]|uniref:Putative NotI-like restriction endonuclease n=1 Tax=Advenella mimigardefordensis (strain DSM 17166 / LMG 22922 / DPN7) TaxID=1247726 RepID=W0PKF7_ADVMD|nr:NotI family restriction endonuclease [Advenella mimigardefordensis]AHG65488.1 putative NotI-like restriction endonuclease [Advenella mimigardefordensis DPN7]